MRPFRFLLSAAFAAVFSSAVAAPMVLNRGNGAEPKSLDPHFVDTLAESNVVGDLLTGLTTMDAAARPIPGSALRWETSADGRTWTFHLRDQLWSDARPVMAQDFVFAWQRLMNPANNAAYAYNLWIVKNAHAISDGKLPPAALGIKATDDRTLIVTLEHPAPYLPELLTHETAYPLPRHVLLAKGGAWSKPQNYVGNGAYVPTVWVANDHITMVKNPRFYDAAHVRIDVVNYYPTQDSGAGLNRLRAGELDTQTPMPLSQLAWLRTHMKAYLHNIPYLGLSYVAINFKHPPLNDRRVRRALNLAYNREVITEKVLRLGDPPAYSLVPPGVANYPRTAKLDFWRLPYAARLEKARWLMEQAGYGPGNRLHLTYEMVADPDQKRIAAVMQAMLKAIYIDLEIVPVDSAIHYRNLRNGDFDLGAASWFADFNDATSFLDLFRHDGGKNYSRYANPKFDALLDQAMQERDIKKRGALLLAAETIALSDYPWIPTRFRTTQDLVAPYVKGWVENVRDFNRTRWLWIEGKPARR
ncbi:MAG TPA: peptide ABC transporter substrate-binding protein [Rhizomicrobium sp.]|jgi:oligopeptide transport system substrate-binding protein|nr:peptide ABC transporter substrate-binding protein [Rhizomicrobium sp.]